MKVLITAGKSAAAFKQLKKYPSDQVILADYGDMPRVPSGSYQFISLGTLNPETIAHTLLTFCLDHTIDAVLPLQDFEKEALTNAGVLFEEFGVQVLSADEGKEI